MNDWLLWLVYGVYGGLAAWFLSSYQKKRDARTIPEQERILRCEISVNLKTLLQGSSFENLADCCVLKEEPGLDDGWRRIRVDIYKDLIFVDGVLSYWPGVRIAQTADDEEYINLTIGSTLSITASRNILGRGDAELINFPLALICIDQLHSKYLDPVFDQVRADCGGGFHAKEKDYKLRREYALAQSYLKGYCKESKSAILAEARIRKMTSNLLEASGFVESDWSDWSERRFWKSGVSIQISEIEYGLRTI